MIQKISEPDRQADPFRTEGMLIVPCSMKTVAGIHSGYADNLILRAADADDQGTADTGSCSKAETPLSAIHLRNLSELTTIPGGPDHSADDDILPSAGEYRRDDISYCGKAGGAVRDRGENTVDGPDLCRKKCHSMETDNFWEIKKS